MPRPEIHPDYHPVIFKDDDYELVTRSTMTSKETREVDGVEHYVIRLDISSASHPFWTGQQRFVDTEGRVERFRAKYGLGKKKSKKEEKAEEAPAEEAKAEEAPAEEAPAEEAPAEEAPAEEAPAEEAPAEETEESEG